MRRYLLACLVLILVAAPAHAASRRRAVSIPALPEATLTAEVVDFLTNKPVVLMVVEGPGVFVRSDTSGKLSVKLPIGQQIPLTFTRTGYQPRTEVVTIFGNTMTTFRVEPKPTVKLTTRSGVVYELDSDSFEFGYPEFYLGYRRDRKTQMCRAGGGAFTLDRDDVRRLRGPAFSSIELGCCSRGTPVGLEVQLVSGETMRAYFLDSCEGRGVELIAHDHHTWATIFVRVTDVSEVLFP